MSLALPFLPGHVTPEMGLKHDGRPALDAVLRVELARPNLSLQPGKAMLDLEIEKTNDSQSFFTIGSNVRGESSNSPF